MPRPGVIFQSTSIWDIPSETIAPGRNVALRSIRTHDAIIKEVPIDMTSVNVDAILAMVPLLEKQTQEKLVLDIVFKHEIGCTCSLCESLRSRFPLADADHPDRFAEQGGEHQTAPFDATNTVQLQSIAKSLGTIATFTEKTAAAIESARDVLRGRDSENREVKGPIRAIADFLLRGQPQATPPQTQRNPATTVASAQPVQAPLFGASEKRVATDQELQQFIANLSKFTPKIRFDKPKQWPKESQKGRTILTTNGQGVLGSEVDPDYLDIYADSIEYFANEAKKKVTEGSTDANHKRDAQYGELEAARYRRIALMVRAGQIQRVAAAPPQVYAGGADDYG